MLYAPPIHPHPIHPTSRQTPSCATLARGYPHPTPSGVSLTRFPLTRPPHPALRRMPDAGRHPTRIAPCKRSAARGKDGIARRDAMLASLTRLCLNCDLFDFYDFYDGWRVRRGEPACSPNGIARRGARPCVSALHRARTA
jgi:hypothetical protein